MVPELPGGSRVCEKGPGTKNEAVLRKGKRGLYREKYNE